MPLMGGRGLAQLASPGERLVSRWQAGRLFRNLT